jgi:uncharacterized membrane protein YgcG
MPGRYWIICISSEAAENVLLLTFCSVALWLFGSVALNCCCFCFPVGVTEWKWICEKQDEGVKMVCTLQRATSGDNGSGRGKKDSGMFGKSQ